MNTLLVTVDSLRYDHFEYMPRTQAYLDETHERTFATSTATLGSFPSIIGGEYPDGSGLPDGASVFPFLDGHRVGITTNHLLSPAYGYDDGFDSFASPPCGGESTKDRAAYVLTQGTLPYRIAAWGWSQYQRLLERATGIPKSFRPAEAVIDDFTGHIEGIDEWSGWLHFMEPHHPYDPTGADVSRSAGQEVSRRVINGGGDESDQTQVRDLYRSEVEDLDGALGDLWETIPDDTRVVFCADHGELLGEGGQWGHPGLMRPELLHVPFAGRNLPELGDVVSLIDVPTILRGERHGQGALDREYAFATYADVTAATDGEQIVADDGVIDLDGARRSTDPMDAPTPLRQAWERFDPDGVRKSDALESDLEALGYA